MRLRPALSLLGGAHLTWTLAAGLTGLAGLAGVTDVSLLAGLADVSASFQRCRGAGAEGVAGSRPSPEADVRAVREDEASDVALGGAALVVHDAAVPTNMVVFQVQGLKGEWRGPAGAAAFCRQLARRGVLMFPYGGRGERIRAVTHKHVDAEAIDLTISAVRLTLESPDLATIE